MTATVRADAPLPNGARVVEDSVAGEGAKKAQRDRLLEAVLEACVTFWQDPDGIAYATVPAGGGSGQQRYRVRSRRFALVVRDLYGRANQRTVGGRGLVIPGSISDTALAETLPALEAMALHGPVWEPDVRACRWQGAVWLDLGGADWRLVRVDAASWRVVDGAVLPLIRPDGLRALPLPARADRGRTLDTLRGLVNIAPDRPRDFMLVVAWLVAALYPDRPLSRAGAGRGAGQRQVHRLPDAAPAGGPQQGGPPRAAPQRG